jgi:hypothetical protein
MNYGSICARVENYLHNAPSFGPDFGMICSTLLTYPTRLEYRIEKKKGWVVSIVISSNNNASYLNVEGLPDYVIRSSVAPLATLAKYITTLSVT